jgi:predicted DNA-binding transcriptional regulator AlpA
MSQVAEAAVSRPPLPRPRYVKAKWVAAYSGLSVATIYRYVEMGKFPPPDVKMGVGKQTQVYLWDREAVVAFIDAGFPDFQEWTARRKAAR